MALRQTVEEDSKFLNPVPGGLALRFRRADNFREEGITRIPASFPG